MSKLRKNDLVYATNKKAQFDYFIEKTFETGIVLTGPEVKSIRHGKISLKESYVKIIKSEVFLINANCPMESNISSFSKKTYDEKRPKKLLLTKKEINYLIGAIGVDGYTLIATKVYQPPESTKIKVTVALAKGKKLYDKRQSLKEKDIQRETKRALMHS